MSRSHRGLGTCIGMLPAMVPIGIAVGVFAFGGTVVAETLSDCLATRVNERKAARAASDREAAACSGDRQCVKDAQAKWNAAAKPIDEETGVPTLVLYQMVRGGRRRSGSRGGME